MTARVTALTDARTEAEKALQTAQASVAEQKRAAEQERQRGDALVGELASAREEVEARKAAANAADASAKSAQASAAEQKQTAEQERQQIEVLARQLAAARDDVGTLTARVTALTDARTEAEKALQTAQASAAEQKQAAEQERQRGDALVRELASAREWNVDSSQSGRKCCATLPRSKLPKLRPPSRSRLPSKSASKLKSSPVSWRQLGRMSER